MGETSSFHLSRAFILLNELFESKQDLKPAAERFAGCHWICLQQGDVDGFQWSIRVLQGIINNFPEELEQDHLFEFLLQCFHRENEQESSQAMAAFHVATRHLSASRFLSCLDVARSDFLKYHAAMGLGLCRQNSAEFRDALKWFRVSESIADKLEPEYKVIASYQILTTLVQLGEIEEVKSVQEVSVVGSVLSSALLSMINAKIKKREELPRKDVVLAYAEARRKLLKFMVNINHKLAEKLGSSPCSLRCLLNYSRFTRFTQFYMMMLGERETPPGIPLKSCFVAYELYREARLEIIKLQESWSDAEDVRSHIEEGIEVMYQKSPEVSVTAVDSLVLAHQIAFKNGDLDSLWSAGTFLDEYIRCETRGNTPGMIARMTACFEKYSMDDEDSQAWTKYYVGREGATNGKVSGQQYKFLQESLEGARTPILRYLATYALANASTETKKVHEYLERSKNHALETGEEELVIRAQIELFHALIQSQMFQRAHEIERDLKAMSSKFLHARFAEGVSEFMQGFLRTSWGDMSATTCRHFERAIELLEPLQTPYHAALSTYLGGRHKKENLSYFGRAHVYLQSANAAIMRDVCKTSALAKSGRALDPWKIFNP